MYEEYTNYPTWALAQWIHNEQESTEQDLRELYHR